MPIPDSQLPGHRHLHDRVCTALDLCEESPNIDFKESASWGNLKWTIIKNVLSMGNLRDGGVIIIGASERNGQWQLPGITDVDLQTYDPDVILGQINAYVSPHANVRLVTVTHTNANRFLAVQIFEFDELPLVCKRNGPDGEGIIEGGVYVRPAGVPRATRITNADHMRNLLRLAAEKQARSMLEDAGRLGLLQIGAVLAAALEPDQQFEDEREGL
jgi:hypothetical protein